MNTAQAMPWWGWLFFAGFFLLLGLTGVMFVSILRQGDERRRLILLHAGSTSFSAFKVSNTFYIFTVSHQRGNVKYFLHF